MKRDRLLILWPFFLILCAFIMEAAYLIARISTGYSDYPAFYFALSLLLIGISAVVISSGVNKLGTRIDRLERQLKESDGQQEALRESLRGRVGKLERDLDATQAAPSEQPKP